MPQTSHINLRFTHNHKHASRTNYPNRAEHDPRQNITEPIPTHSQSLTTEHNTTKNQNNWIKAQPSKRHKSSKISEPYNLQTEFPLPKPITNHQTLRHKQTASPKPYKTKSSRNPFQSNKHTETKHQISRTTVTKPCQSSKARHKLNRSKREHRYKSKSSLQHHLTKPLLHQRNRSSAGRRRREQRNRGTETGTRRT